MFRFWTVQHKSVLDVVAMNGFYQADISKSPFVMENPPREELYRFLLDAFNKANDFRLNGLIFGFAYREGSQIRNFQDVYEFAAFLKQKRTSSVFCGVDFAVTIMSSCALTIRKTLLIRSLSI